MAPKRTGAARPAPGYFAGTYQAITDPENRSIVTAVSMFAVSLPNDAEKSVL